MTLEQKNAADAANTSQRKEVGGFSNSFRSSVLNNFGAEEHFVIPTNYRVFERKIGTGADARIAQYINIQTDGGRTLEFYPTAMARIAFEVDENGKNLRENGRMVVKRSHGTVCDFIDGQSIDAAMQAMKGCKIHYKEDERVKTRAFGVPESTATSKDVTTTIIGEWNFEGDTKPKAIGA